MFLRSKLCFRLMICRLADSRRYNLADSMRRSEQIDVHKTVDHTRAFFKASLSATLFTFTLVRCDIASSSVLDWVRGCQGTCCSDTSQTLLCMSRTFEWHPKQPNIPDWVFTPALRHRSGRSARYSHQTPRNGNSKSAFLARVDS